MGLLNRYPISALVFEPREGGGTFVSQDKVGAFKKKGGIGLTYKLKKRKDKLDPQRYVNFLQGKKKRLLMLWTPAKGIYEPLRVDDENFKLTANQIAWMETHMNNVREAYSIFQRKGFFEKYMPLIMLIAFGFIMLMTFIVVRQDLIQLIQTIGQSASGSIPGAAAPINLG